MATKKLTPKKCANTRINDLVLAMKQMAKGIDLLTTNVADVGSRLRRAEEVLHVGPVTIKEQPPATGWHMTKDWPEFYRRIVLHEREIVIKWLNELSELWKKSDGGSVHIIHPPQTDVMVLHETEDDADSSEVGLDTIFNNFTTNANGVKIIFIGRAHNSHWLLYSVS